MRRAVFIIITVLFVQSTLVGAGEAFDFLDWLNDCHVQVDFGAAPIPVTKPADPVYLRACYSENNCTLITLHSEDLDLTLKPEAQFHWQIPLYLNERLTLGLNGTFVPAQVFRRTTGGYLSYAVSKSFSAIGELGFSTYDYERWEGVVTSGRSQKALTAAAGLRYSPSRSASIQATIQHVGATRIEELIHSYNDQVIPGIDGPAVTFGQNLSIMFSVGLYPPFPSRADLEQQAFSRVLSPQLQGAELELAKAIIQAALRKHPDQIFFSAPKNGVHYDSTEDALIIPIKYYDPESKYKSGIKKSGIKRFNSVVTSTEWKTLNDNLLDSLIDIAGEQARKVANVPDKVVFMVDFALFTVTPEVREPKVEQGRYVGGEYIPPSITVETSGGDVDEIWNFTARVAVVIDPEAPTGVGEVYRGTVAGPTKGR